MKEKADGTTDTTQKGTNYLNFSVTADAMGMAGIYVERDMGIWINAGDSTVPLKVWDVLNGETKDRPETGIGLPAALNFSSSLTRAADE